MPEPGAALEDRAFLAVPVEDAVHRVVDGEDEAGAGLLRHALDADVEPHRAVERRALGDEDELQLGVERVGLGLVDEVATLDAPRGDGVDDPIDDLAQRLLALGVPSVPRKYFWATMLVAFSDQPTGNSTPSCSNATVPSFQLLMRASRRSQATWS